MRGKHKAQGPKRKGTWLKTRFKKVLDKLKSRQPFHEKEPPISSKKEQRAFETSTLLWDKSKGAIGLPYYKNYMFRRVAFVPKGKQGKAKKALIAEAMLGKIVTYWTYYPKPDEALKFAKALKHVGIGNPGHSFPGCVGAVIADVSPKTESIRSIRIRTIQGSYTSRKCPELSTKLTRSHGGWREHILGYVFKKAVEENIRTVSYIGSPISWGQRIRLSSSEKKRLKTFLRIAKRNGFKRKRDSKKTELVVQRP